MNAPSSLTATQLARRRDEVRAIMSMSYGDPEIELDPACPGCGSRAVFTAVAPPG
jgi:hypothetical protein